MSRPTIYLQELNIADMDVNIEEMLVKMRCSMVGCRKIAPAAYCSSFHIVCRDHSANLFCTMCGKMIQEMDEEELGFMDRCVQHLKEMGMVNVHGDEDNECPSTSSSSDPSR